MIARVARRSIRCVSVSLVLAASSACTGSLLESDLPLPQIYVLAPIASPATRSSTPVGDVVIAEPSAAPGLATDRIAVLYADRRLDYYAAARWGGNATQVVQSLLVASLQNLGGFNSVSATPAGVAGSHVIDMELRDFQAEYGGGGALPAVRVTLVAHVLRVRDRHLLDTVMATAVVPATENRLAAVVGAFEAAARQVATQLGAESAAAIAADTSR